jgi:acylphosphatase
MRQTAGTKTVRICITGRVQGVGYRLWATRTATKLGLHGWVRNRADGSVEALVTGDPQDVAAMVQAARQGPPAAQVADVTVTPDSDDGSVGFAAIATE